MARNVPTKQSIARRVPRQARAEQTRLLIFEAAVRVLEREGWAGFNTNRIAEVAGFSVGTLYQYFADKQAILEALAQHEQERALAELAGLLRTQAPGSAAPGVRIRAVVRAALRVFGGRHKVRKLLIERAMRLGRQAVLDRPLLVLAETLVARSGFGSGVAALNRVEAFVLTRAVAGVVRSALASDERLLRQADFEDALVDLVEGFLRVRVRLP